MEKYDGSRDEALNLGSANTIAASGTGGKNYTVKIVNNALNNDQKVILLPSRHKVSADNQARQIRTGVIPFVVGATSITCEGTPRPVEEMLEFIEDEPILITGIRLNSKNPLQFENDIVVTTYNPFNATPVTQSFNLGSLVSEFASNDKILRFKQPIVKTRNNEISLVVASATGVVGNVTPQQLGIVFEFGAALSIDTLFARKVQAAL